MKIPGSLFLYPPNNGRVNSKRQQRKHPEGWRFGYTDQKPEGKGGGVTLKQGTLVKKIRLTDNDEEVDCKVDGMSIVLRTEFLKKR